MKSGGGVIALRLSSPDLKQLSILAPEYIIKQCVDPRDLCSLIERGRPTLVVADIRSAPDPSLEVELIAAGSRRIPIVVRLSIAPGEVQLLIALVRGGVAVEAALEGLDNLATVAIRVVSGLPDTAVMHRLLLGSCGASGRRAACLLTASVLLGMRRPSMRELARLCGWSRRTMERVASAASLPSPGRLVALSCCVQLAWLATQARLTPRALAAAGGFTSTQALSHYLRRQAGETPRKLGHKHRLEALLDSWRDAVRCAQTQP